MLSRLGEMGIFRRGDMVGTDETPVSPLDVAVGLVNIVVTMFADADDVTTCGILVRNRVLVTNRRLAPKPQARTSRHHTFSSLCNFPLRTSVVNTKAERASPPKMM